MIKESFYRFFKRKRFLLSLFIIILINAVDIIPRFNTIIFNNKLLIPSAFVENIIMNGSDNNGFILFMFLSFILANLPMSDAFVEDRESGVYKTYMLKISNKEYIIKKFLLNFLYSGFNVAIVLIINFLIWLILRPSFVITYYNTTLINDIFMVDLLVKNSFLFLFVHVFKVFLIGGVIGSFGMFLNDIFNSKYISLGGVFLFDLVLSLILSILGENIELLQTFQPINSLLGGYLYNINYTTIMYLLILFSISLIYFMFFKKNKEII